MIEDTTTLPDDNRETPPAIGQAQLRARAYRARSGLSTPIVTVLDREGRVIPGEQRSVIHYAVQEGAGADIIFAAGTTGEWNRLDNPRRQMVIAHHGRRMREALTRKDRRSRLGRESPRIRGRDAGESGVCDRNRGGRGGHCAALDRRFIDAVDFMTREIGAVFEQHGAMLPIFLYDNADIAAHEPSHISHTRDVKRMQPLELCARDQSHREQGGAGQLLARGVAF